MNATDQNSTAELNHSCTSQCSVPCEAARNVHLTEAPALQLGAEPVRMARIWYEELGRLDGREAKARRQHIGALLQVIDGLRETNRRLNLRCQQAESTAAVFIRAVNKWELAQVEGKRRTYIPIRTLTTIAAAAGAEFDAEFYEDHAGRLSRLATEASYNHGENVRLREVTATLEQRIEELVKDTEVMEKDSAKLTALENAGVNSWEGYDNAMRSLD